MKSKIRFIKPDGSPAAEMPVAVVRFNSADPKETAWESAPKVSQGHTDAGGRWTFENKTLQGSAIVGLMAMSIKNEGTIIFRSLPTALSSVPLSMAISLEIDPTGSGGDEGGNESNGFFPKSQYAGYLTRRQAVDGQLREQTYRAISGVIRRRMEGRKKGKLLAHRYLGQRPKLRRQIGTFIPWDGESTLRLTEIRDRGLNRLNQNTKKRRGVVVREGFDLVTDPGKKQALNSEELRNALDELRVTRKKAPYEHYLYKCTSRHRLDMLKSGNKREAQVNSANNASHSSDERPDHEDVTRNLANTLPTGPADATAYYHVNTLQVAWEDTWTGVFDKNLEQDISKLYEELVEEMSFDGADEALQQMLNEKEELVEAIAAIEELVGAATSEMVAPTEIAGWLPEVSANWSKLSPIEREEILFLFRVDSMVRAFYANRFSWDPPPST